MKTAYGLVMVLGFALLIGGCAKKETEKAKMIPPPALSTSTKDSATDKEKADLFDELYSDKPGTAKQGEHTKPPATASRKKSGNATPVADASLFSEHGHIAIQVSCVRSKPLALKIMNQLKDKGYPAYIVEVESPNSSLSGTFFRVRIGPFSTVEAARKFGESHLSNAGFEFWIDKKSNDTVGKDGYGTSAPASENGYEYSAPAPSGNSSSSWGTPSSATTQETATPAPAPATTTTTETKPAESGDDWGTSTTGK